MTNCCGLVNLQYTSELSNPIAKIMNVKLLSQLGPKSAKNYNLLKLFFLSTVISLSFIQQSFTQDATIQVDGNSIICDGESTTLEVIIGASINPYTVTYSDGTSDFTVNNYTSDADPESPTYGGDPISVSPTVTTTYSLVSVLDQFSTSLPISATTVTITVNPLPTNITPTINSGNPICYNTSFVIDATATDGNTYELWNEANTVKIGDIPYNATITANTNFNIIAISVDGCQSSAPLTTILESIVPSISGEGDKILNTDIGTCSTSLPDYTSTVTVSDNCSIVGNITLTQNPVSGSSISDHNTIQPVVITATDESGNSNTYNFNVTLIDNEAPGISCVLDQPVDANNGCSYDQVGTAWDASATDNCTIASVAYVLTGATTGTGTTLNGVTFLAGITTVTWTVTDGAGLTASCNFDVTISDSENPTVTCVADQVRNTSTGDCTYTYIGTSWNATAADNCGTPSVSYGLTGATTATVATSLDGVVFNKGVTNIIVTVTDGAGNAADPNCSFTVTINDTENPVLVDVPINISVNNDVDSCDAIVSWTEPTATDNCTGESIAQTAGLSIGSFFPIGISTITYTVTDGSGNEDVGSFNITVTDSQDPEITCPTDITQNIDAGTCGAVVTFTAPVGTDNCPGVNTVQTAGLISGSAFPVGDTINTFEVTDASSNTTSCSFTVTITDNEIPVISDCPTDITQDNDTDSCNAVVTWVEPTVADNCTTSGNITWTKSHTPGSIFPLGTTVVTYVAEDESGNVSVTCSFDVTINDTQVPVIVGCPTDITKSSDLGSCDSVVSWTEPSANDNCTSAGNIVWTKSHTPGTLFPSGTTTVTYTATDEASNASITCSFDVIVVDTQKPVISNCPTTITQDNDADSCDAVITWVEPTASDNCTAQGNLVWAKSHIPGDAFSVGTTTVTYTATDITGNISNACSFDVIISDTQAPTAVCASPTIFLNSSGVATLTVNDVNNGSSDNCTIAGNLIITLSKTTFNCSNKGANSVIMTVKDASGNTDTCTATITVADNIDPTLTSTVGTVDSNLNADTGQCSYTVKGSELDPVGVDNCSGVSISYTVTGATSLSGTGSLAGESLLEGANVITWTASDGTNTSLPLSFTKTVIDNQPPSVSSVGNKYKGTTLGECGYLVSGTEFDAIYSDNCAISLVSYTINSGASVNSTTLNGVLLATGINTIVWTVSDGITTNSSTFRVTVADDELPAITPINDITQEITSGCEAVVNWTEPTATDNCAVSSFSQTLGLSSGSSFPVGVTAITYTATDNSGNISSMSFNVTVVDLTPPVLTCPSGSSIAAPFARNADTGICFYTVAGTEFDATTNDGCAFTAATNSFDGTATLEGKELPVGDHEITWTATDEFNNSSSCTIYVRVTDTQNPTFNQPTGNPALSYNYDRNSDPASCVYTISDSFFDLRNISDNCDTQEPTFVITKNGTPQFIGTNTLSGIQLPSDELFPYVIVWTLTDVNGNAVVADDFTITVTDNQAPTFECYGNEIRNIPSDVCNYTIVGTEFDPMGLADNCDNTSNLTVSFILDGNSGGALTTLAGQVLDAGVHTVVWTITDSKGNTAVCNFNITIVDIIVPIIAPVSNQTRNAPDNSCLYTTVGTEFDPATVTDNCPTYTLVNNQSATATLAGFEFPVGITVVVWTVTDSGGNVATMEYQVEIIDVDAPDFDINGENTSVVAITKSVTPSKCYYKVNGTEFDPHNISDNCTTANFTILNDFNSYLSLTNQRFPVGTTNVSWSVKDNYGNETIKTLQVTVVDDELPQISCPTGDYLRIYDANQEFYAIKGGEFTPSTSDNCGIDSFSYVLSGATTGTGNSLSGVQLTEGENTIVWTVLDTATPANETTCTITVNVLKDLYPEISCVANQSRNTDTGICTYSAVGTEFDATSETPGVTFTNNINATSTLAGEEFSSGSTFVLWTVSQTIEGQVYSSNCSFYVEVIENELPTITAPADISILPNSGCYATSVNLGSPTTSDNCGISSVSSSPSSGSWFRVGETIVTWSVRDTAGNIATDTQIVTVRDEVNPSFTCKPELCNTVDAGQLYYTVSGSEYDPINVYDCSTYTLVNDFNNSSTLNGAQLLASASPITVEWTITDSSGNVSTCSSIITISDDNTPSVGCLPRQVKTVNTVGCLYTVQGTEFDISIPVGATMSYTLTGATTATGSDTLSGVTFNAGSTTVEWSVTEGGFTNTCCKFDVQVNNDRPTITAPADVSVNVDSGSCIVTNVALGTPTAADFCDSGATAITARYPNGTALDPLNNNFNVGVTTITWIATDESGLTRTATQRVNVSDDIAPVIDCPITTYYREYTNPFVNYYLVQAEEFKPSVTDNCEVVSYTNDLNGTRYLNSERLLIGDHTIKWTALDSNPGTPNSSDCDVNITIVDSFDPIIDCPSNQIENNSPGLCGYTIPEGETAYDATFVSISGDNRTMTHNLVGAPSTTTLAGAFIPKGVNTITWTATQDIGGTEYSNTCSFNFTVTDDEAPILVLPFDNVTVNVDPGTCTNTFTLTLPTAADNCSNPEDITITSNAPTTFLLGTTNVIWDLIDEAGNVTEFIQQVTVYDNEPPTISNCPATDITAVAGGDNCRVSVSWPSLFATDDCSGMKSFTSTHSPGTLFDVGTTTVTYTATDKNDNILECSFNVVVTDTAPTISCITDQTRSADSGTCDYKVLGNEFDPVSFNDNCTSPTISWSFTHPETLELVTGVNTLSGVSVPRGSDNGPTTGQIEITWTATDTAGQTASCSFVLTITDDEGPILVVPGNQIRSTDLNQNYYTVKNGEFDDVTSTDNCGIVTKLVNEFGVTTLDGIQMQMGENSVTWEATDDSGNLGSANFFAYIIDTELPRLENAPTNISVDAGSSCSAAVDYVEPTFIDNVTAQGDLDVTVSPSNAATGNIFPVGETQVTYIVLDESGNLFSYNFIVTVTDNLDPTITCPIGSPGNQFSRNTDLGDDSYTALGAEFNPSSFDDNCTVTISNDYNASATLSGATFPIGTTDVIWTATDSSGNTANCTIQVIVIDNEIPEINSCPDASVSRNSDLDACYYTVTSSEFDPYDFNDNSGVSKLTYSIDGAAEVGTDVNTTLVGAQIPVGTSGNLTTTVLWRLYDLSDNVSATCTTVFTITDTELPDLTPIATQTRSLDTGLSTYSANITTDTSWDIAITDNCTLETITYQIDGGAVVGTDLSTSIIGEAFTVGIHTVSWEATDIYGNSNTGIYQVIIEDNEAPTAVCNDITIQLDNTGSYSLTSANIDAIALGSIDPSGIATTEVSPNSFDCIDVGDNTVTLTLTDNHGNVSTCNATVTVQDVTPPTAICRPVTVYLDALGNAVIKPSDINNGSSDACGVASISASQTSFDCTDVGDNTVTLTVTDVNGNSATCDAIVTILDDVEPVAVCKNITVSLDANGDATIAGLDIDNGSYDNCFSTLVRTATPNIFDCTDIGENVVTLTVTDPAGNSDTCTAIVTVQDLVAPTVVCQDITIQLDASGDATIVAADIDNGSSDACGIASLAIDKTDFDCTNLGSNPVTNTVVLTVTDTNGNVDTCSALVTVEDTVVPTIFCTTDKVVTTDNNLCSYTHNGITWDTTTSDGCSTIASLTYELSGATIVADAPANTSLDNETFNSGITTVTWTAIDGSGNSSQCSYTVTVNDDQVPNSICQDITIQLDAAGNASIIADDINNGSNDNCGIQSVVASKTDFTCSDFGPNSVTLTVTDTNNNESTCTATVTVQDIIDPVAVCAPITIQLDALGSYTLNATDINNISVGSSDNCSIVTREVSPNTFICANIGAPVDVTLTVTDIAGNTDTCSTTITVEDNVAPTAICQDITIQLDASGNASITGNDIDNGSNDACGIATRVADKTAFTCADLGPNAVTLTVTDNNGNTDTCIATVTVQDISKPIFTLCSANQTEFTDLGVCTFTKTNTSWDATATDNCGVSSLTYNLTGATTGSGTTLNGVAFNKGVTTITWTATDASSNSEICSYTLTVTDTEAPNAICQIATVELGRDGTVVVVPAQIDNNSTDNCGIDTYEISKDGTNYFSSVTFDCSEIGSNTTYLRVADEAGLTDVCSTTVTVDDTQAPTLDDLTDRNEVVDSGVCTYTHGDNLLNPTDNCDPSPTITYTVSGATTVVTAPNTTLNGQVFEKGTTTVTWTVADHSAPVNSDTVSFDIIVTDTQNPTISCPANITQDVASGGDTSVTVAAITAPTYDDNCVVTELTYELSGATTAAAQVTGINELSSDTFNLGTTTVTYIAYDAAGNSETCSFTITVNALADNTVVVSPTTIETNEDLGFETFTVVLPSAPTGTVVFNVVSSDTSEGTVDLSQLTFNAGNWNIPQTVTVTGVNDDVDDGDIPYTIQITTNQGLTDDLSGYENVDPADVSATNLDNDIAGVTVSTISNDTSEDGDTATFTIVLDTEPTDDVTITLTSDDLTESDTFSPTTLTFTPLNWSDAQTVTVTGKDDDIVDGDINYNIETSTASSTDPNYNTMVVDDVAIVNLDNDTAGFIVTPLTLNTTEAAGAGKTATFTVVLTSKPATDATNYVVVVDVASNDLTEGTVDLSQLTFNAGNWNIPQTITVTGVDEIIVDGDITYTILNTINAGLTTDTNYDPLNPDDVSVTNADDDAATLSINSIAVDEGNAGTTNFIFTVTHSGAQVDGGYGVSFYTLNGTAKAPTDFAGNGGTVNFTTGAIGETQTITIVVNGDTAVESNETFSVVLNSVTAPGKDITINPGGKTGVGTIINDDNATLSIDDETIIEGDSGTQTLTFTVTLDREVEDGLTVDYTTVDTSATTADSDYVVSSGTLTFTGTAGETQTIDVTINGDEKVELDETFLVNLSNIAPVSAPGSAITFADASAIGTITNDDSAVISITGVTVNEDVGTADFTITMDKSVQTAFTIDFATSNNTAVSPSDYTAASTTLNFGDANALTQTVTITIIDDNVVETVERLNGTISNLTDASNQDVIFLGGGASAQTVIIINNNDTATFVINDVTVNEDAGIATFTITLTGTVQNQFEAKYNTIDASALTPSDYSEVTLTTLHFGGSNNNVQTIDIPIIDDGIAEPTETFDVRLITGDLFSQFGVSVSDNIGVGTITDNDPLQLDIAGFSITETEATQTANFVITSDIASQEDIIITFTTTDISTTSGSDLTSQTTQPYTLTAGATTWNIPVDILGDLISEPTETFTGAFALSNVNGQQVSIGTASDTSTILDNDAVVINLVGFTVTETDGTQSQNFVASTNIAAQHDIVLSFSTADGTALDGNDYTAQAATVVTILAGTTSVNIPVDILGDLITEPQEAFTATISITNTNAQQVSIGTGTDTVTINDNDPAIISIAGFSVNEAAGTADYTITLNRTVQNAFTVDFATSNITALAGSDYTAVGATTLNFGAANLLVQTITVTINDDDLVEPSETLLGTLSNLVANSQAITIPTPTATSTITDNEAASVVIDDVTVTEDVASGTAVFTVTLTGHIQDALTVDYTTTDGAAVNPALQPSDYTSTTGTLTFPAGSNTGATQTITVPIIDNTIAEPTETYTVDLSNIISTGSASIVDAEGLGTITDDDPVTAINLAGFTITETNGNVLHNFVASIDIAAQEEIVISYTTTNSTAVGTDFTAQTAVQYTILPGDLFVNIPIEVIGDLVIEPQEAFTGAITLVNANGQQVSIGTDTATGIINDDDAAIISIAGFTVDEAVGTADFTITSNQTIQNAISVVFGTSNISATAGSDYTAVASTTLNFGAANANSQTVTITIADDNITEPTELLNGILSSFVTNGQAVTLNGGGAIASAVGTIIDNDAATLTIDDVTQVEVDGGSTVNYVFTVTHNGQSTDGAFTVNYSTLNIEALAGLDYVANSGTLNFSGTTGETQTITIVVNGDDILEPTETFTVDLTENDFGGRDITFSDDSGLGTITDNDVTTVGIVANDATAAEPSNNGQFTVSIGLESSTDTEISYTISGTATAANDYTTLTGTVTIPAGSTSATIDVLVINDNILEASETVTITLDAIDSGDVNISIGTPVDATVTIADEDTALVSISANDAVASEPSNDGQFTVSISNASDVDTDISYLITGTATATSDYTTLTGTVTIPAGSTSAIIDVTVVDDTILETSETVIVTLNTITSGDADTTIDGANDTATVTIADNDAASLAIGDISVTEGANAVFTITLTGAVQGGFAIDYATADGSATVAGLDYTSGSGTLNFAGTDTEFYAVTIATNDDDYLEAVENFVLDLSAISNALVTYDNQAIATLNDNDAASLTVSDITVDEGDNAVFTVTLTGNVQGGVSIDYTTVDNSAIDISDYTSQSGTLNFTGTTPESFTITVPTVEDIIAESTEAYYLNFSSITNALVTYDVQAIGTITDDDIFTISIADNSIAETESAQILNFAVTMTGEAQEDVVLSFSTTQVTATAAIDYITESAVVVIIPAGSTSVNIPVNILGDLILEPTETFTGTITLSNANGQTISIADGTAIGTITDNDNASIAIGDVAVDEGAGTATFTVTLTGDVQDSFDVDYATTANTAIAGVDYTTTSGTLTFPANAASGATQTFTVAITDDTQVEPSEDYTITLSNITGLTTIADGTAIGTITDNDSVTLSINNITNSEGNSGVTNFDFIVSLSNVSSLETTIDYVTVDGTATVIDGDYTSLTQSVLTFLPGETVKTISVSVNGDRLVEPDETFTVELSNLITNGNDITLGNTIGIGTIVNDDHPPVLSDVIMYGIEDNDLLFGEGDFITSFTDADGDSLYSIEILSLPTNGILYLNNVEVFDGDVILASDIDDLMFTPDANWFGTTSFDYNASDGFNMALIYEQVIITITSVNDLPIAIDDFASTQQNVPIIDWVTAINDIPSGDGGNVWSLVGVDGGATNGTVTMNSDGVYTYTPDLNFFGVDSFIYSITDIDGDVSNATVTITVMADPETSIELIKTASIDGEGALGDIITYTFTVTNTGNIAITNIVIDDPLISPIPIAVVGTLEPNATATVNAYYTITQEDIDLGYVTNSATVSGVDVLGNVVTDTSDDGDPIDGNDNPTITSLVQSPEIAIIKTAIFNDDNHDGFAQAGETITYNFIISNIGNVTLTDIVVLDPLPGVVVTGGPISLDAGEFDDTSFVGNYVITQQDINLGNVTNQASVSGRSLAGVVVEDSSDDFDNYGDNPTVLQLSGCVIEVFNAVSPNNDGVNDAFYIRGLECYTDNVVEIYNRWGALVYERDHYNNTDRPFVGISEGRSTVNRSRELPDGVYYYVLKYRIGNSSYQQKAGYLYINRR